MDKAFGSLEEKVRVFVSERLAVKLEAFDKSAEKIREKSTSNESKHLEERLCADRTKLQEKYEVRTWLTDAAHRAGQINMVTHAPKYTHSDTRGMGIFTKKSGEECPYFCSATLQEFVVDVVGNAAALDVAGLLLLEVEDRSLLDEIGAGNSPSLAAIAESEDQLQEWIDGFGKALRSKELTSGQLSKQLYFPLGSGEYHLISPLYASSLAQYVYEKLTDSFYSEAAKAARKAKKSQKYNSSTATFYPNIAKQSFGGTKPQNISQLNTNRYGQGFLFSCQPPQWKSQQTPPSLAKNSFWQEYDRRAWKTAKQLQQYLEKIFTRSSTMEQREFRAELVDDLIDILLSYAAEVQNLINYAGWSVESKLSKAEQLWLDPHRGKDDVEFRTERKKNDWQEEIARQFATWLNHKISHKSKVLDTDDYTFNFWKKLLEKKLALLKEDLEVIA